MKKLKDFMKKVIQSVKKEMVEDPQEEFKKLERYPEFLDKINKYLKLVGDVSYSENDRRLTITNEKVSMKYDEIFGKVIFDKYLYIIHFKSSSGEFASFGPTLEATLNNFLENLDERIEEEEKRLGHFDIESNIKYQELKEKFDEYLTILRKSRDGYIKPRDGDFEISYCLAEFGSYGGEYPCWIINHDGYIHDFMVRDKTFYGACEKAIRELNELIEKEKELLERKDDQD